MINPIEHSIQEPEIRQIPERKLVGMHVQTSLSNNRTAGLWQRFMPRRKEITNQVNNDFYSINIYKDFDLTQSNPDSLFEKWAAVEVKDFTRYPEGMETFRLSGGKYAVFIHKGPTSTFSQTSQFIYEIWIPESDYELDNREHFELLGSNYHGPIHPDSEEEVWVPIK